MKRLVLSVFCAVQSLATGIQAGAELVVDPDVPTYSISGANQVVRGPTGDLYCVFVDEESNGDRSLRLRHGPDLENLSPFVFNDSSSGLTGSLPANACGLAIDSQGVLHAVWGRYHRPANVHRKYYRSYDPFSGLASPIVELSPSAPAEDMSSMSIVVDSNDEVWTTSRAGVRLSEELVHAPATSGGAFMSVGQVNPASPSERIQLAVDMWGRIHCSFFSLGICAHRYYDPLAPGWGASVTNLSGPGGTQDNYIRQASDGLGNVHVVFMKDSSSDPKIIYRRFDGVSWGPSVTVTTFTPLELGSNSADALALAVRESDGHIWVGLRDFADEGQFVAYEKPLPASTFSRMSELLPPSTAKNVYFSPRARGSLYPAFNNTGNTPEFTLRRGTSSPFELLLLRFLGVPDDHGTCGAGSAGVDLLTIDGSSGGASRHVVVAVNQPFLFSMDSPPSCSGGSTLFGLFLRIGAPLPGEETSFRDWGTTCFAPFNMVLIPAPVSLPSTLSFSGQVSVQALLEDCAGSGVVSNLVVLDVVP